MTALLLAAQLTVTIPNGVIMSSAPAPTPAEAAAILAQPHESNARTRGPCGAPCDGSVYAIPPPPSGLYGLPPTIAIPPRRLDGSLWTDPPWMSITYLGRRHFGHREFRPGILEGSPSRDREGVAPVGRLSPVAGQHLPPASPVEPAAGFRVPR